MHDTVHGSMADSGAGRVGDAGHACALGWAGLTALMRGGTVGRVRGGRVSRVGRVSRGGRVGQGGTGTAGARWGSNRRGRVSLGLGG